MAYPASVGRPVTDRAAALHIGHMLSRVGLTGTIVLHRCGVFFNSHLRSFLGRMSLRYSVRRGNPGDEARVGDADADEGASSSGWKAEIESITNGAAGRKTRRHLLCLR